MELSNLIKELEKKQWFGVIDKLNRGEITKEKAEEVLLGKSSMPVLPSQRVTAYEFARELKQKGCDRKESWSRWIQYMALRPGMDAKDWYKIFDKV